ncbi:MAG: outer membrane lipoprotein carrier protein LolA [Planctomycetaceae bacterium]|nr:outer membrane lipoprotein carrier protein LolA [Planctomycetaceae bacterium]
MNCSPSQRAGCFMQSGRIPTHRIFRIACLLIGAALALSAQRTSAAPPPRLSPEHVLREWASISKAILPAGKSAGKRTQHAQRGRHNGHQIALIVEFRGPIDADNLLARYRFTEAKRKGNTIHLTCIPRDGIERLFVPRFEVAFTDDSFLPTSLQFADRNSGKMGKPVAMLIKVSEAVIAELNAPVRAPLPPDIQLVKGEQVNSPEAVKTAAADIPAGTSKPSTEVQRVLAKWKASASQVRTFRADFVRFKYDHIFNLERRSRGSLIYAAPNIGRIDFRPSSVNPGAVSERMGRNSKHYKLESDRSRETWIFTQQKVYQVSHETQQVEVFSKPIRRTDGRKASFFEAIAIAFFDITRVRLALFATWRPFMETEFDWELVNQTSSRLQLKGVPRTERLKSNYSEIGVLLDARTFRVRAIKFVDPAKNTETIFSLQNILVNIDDNAVEFADDRRIETPNLPGYKWIEHGK